MLHKKSKTLKNSWIMTWLLQHMTHNPPHHHLKFRASRWNEIRTKKKNLRIEKCSLEILALLCCTELFARLIMKINDQPDGIKLWKIENIFFGGKKIFLVLVVLWKGGVLKCGWEGGGVGAVDLNDSNSKLINWLL